MRNESFRTELADYILSGHAFLHARTTEKARFLGELRQVCETLGGEGRRVIVWSQAVGWRDADGQPVTLTSGPATCCPVPPGPATSSPALSGSAPSGPPDPQKVAQEILDLPEKCVFVLLDFGFYLEHRTYACADVVIAWLCEIRDVLAATARTVIFLGAELPVPAALANDVTALDFPLPDDGAIEHSVRFVLEDRTLDEAHLPSLISACRGMTRQQIEDRTALALRKFKTLGADAAKLILREKAEILRRTGLLRYQEPPDGGLGLIGGCDAVKEHIRRDRACFTQEARAFGLDPPRGLMLTGISGCGKTAISLSAASELGIPLLQFDVGCLMSKWVGESEANARNALQQVEATLRANWQALHPAIPPGCYPTTADLSQRFGLTWSAFKVTGLPELTGVADVELELEERRVRDAQVRLMEDNLRRECRQFVEEYVLGFRREVGQFCDQVIAQEGRVHGRTLTAIRQRIDRFHAMNIFGDDEAAAKLKRLKQQIAGLTGQDLVEQPDVADRLNQACQALKAAVLDPENVSRLTGRLKRRVVLE